jgi:hypothetical protein
MRLGDSLFVLHAVENCLCPTGREYSRNLFFICL